MTHQQNKKIVVDVRTAQTEILVASELNEQQHKGEI